ncbi:MAG: hypothetical protein ACRDTH_06240 [Pseudonocardiaceae bacterium]
MTEAIHQMLERRGLLPRQHYLDSGYPSAELMTRSRTEFGVELITPLLADQSPQARGWCQVRPRQLRHRLRPPADHLPARTYQLFVEPGAPTRH